MASYRFRIFANGHPYETERDCADDLDALSLAEICALESTVEVWLSTRFVARVKKGNFPSTVRDHVAG